MATIAMPNYIKQAAQQTVQKDTNQDKSLTSSFAQQALNALKANGQPNNPSVQPANKQSAMTNNSSGVQSGSKVMTQNAPNGMMGIRDTLVNRGVDTRRIGWNDATKSVMIDGQDAYKPSSVVDGTSYARSGDIDKMTNTAYANSGEPIAGATSYVAAAGLSNAATWSDGKLMIGGNQVPVMYVDENGKAFAKKSDIDKAIAAYKQNAGITGNQDVYDNWDSKYGDRIQSALNPILNREKWSYSPEDDPAYQAYRDAYTREGNRAYQNAYAQMAANTGGYGSSAGMTAAGQQMNYYMQQLGDRVPELMQNSYNRYLGEQELNRAALSSLMGVADNDYSKAYQSNRDSINDSNTANYQDYLRDISARDYNRQVEAEDRQWDYQKQMYNNQIESGRLSNEAQRISNQMSNIQAVLSKYQYSGNIDTPINAEDAVAMGLTKKADGTYPSIRDIQTVYANLQAEMNKIAWENYGRNELIDTVKINKGMY